MIFPKKVYVVLCDDCREFLRDGAGEIRQFDYNSNAISAARGAGWLVNLPGDKDYCPNCRPKHEN